MLPNRIRIILFIIPAIFVFVGGTCIQHPVEVAGDATTNEHGQQVREVKYWNSSAEYREYTKMVNQLLEDPSYGPDRIFLEQYDPVTREWYEVEYIDPMDKSRGVRLTDKGKRDRRKKLQESEGGGDY